MVDRPDAATIKRKRAAIARRYRAKRPPFSMAAMRVKELDRLFEARHGEVLPDNEDGLTCVRIMVHHIAGMHGDPRRTVTHWLEWHAPWISLAEAKGMIAEAITKPRRWKADKLAWRLKVMAAERTQLAIRTIGAVDQSQAERAELRRASNVANQRRRRRGKGAVTRAQYLNTSASRSKPWQTLGMSRASWYRAGKPTP